MYNQLNIDSPFYINNNFDFTSEQGTFLQMDEFDIANFFIGLRGIPGFEDVGARDTYFQPNSDTDEEFEMSALNQIHTAGSSIHKDLIAFFDTHAIPDSKYEENTKTLKAMFGSDTASWNTYKAAVAAYSNDATEDERLACAISIGDAAVAIRLGKDDSKMTVITEGTAEVNVAGLGPEEITNLKELQTLVLTKMQGTGEKGSAEKANQMVKEFKNDMELAKIDNTFPSRWIHNHGVWKCVQHELQAGRQLGYTENDAGVVDKAGWKKVVDEFNKHKDDAIPQQNTSLSNASNKFAVDVYCATINRYKTTILQAKQNWEHFLRAMQLVSAFLRKSSIKKTEWLAFIRSNEEYKPFFAGIEEANYLYDNPGKLTRARLFACASSVYKAPEPLALFGVENRLAIIPKMIAKIYVTEKKFNIIDKQKGTTSTSEHLFHLLLTLGSANAYVWNRNRIPKSIRETKFNLN